MHISVVIPLLNEEDSLTELHDWIAEVMQSNHFTYEILFIDDGSTDGSWDIISQLSTKNNHVKGICFLFPKSNCFFSLELVRSGNHFFDCFYIL